MNFKSLLKKKIVVLDGAMGTQLQNKLRQRGQDPFGLQPELLNLTHPEIVTEVHREYLLAGANILYTNTFGASRKKLQTSGHTPAARQAIDSVCAAQADRPLIALDIGPLGELMEPSDTLSFAEAYELFCEQVRAGITAGVDLVVLETNLPEESIRWLCDNFILYQFGQTVRYILYRACHLRRK